MIEKLSKRSIAKTFIVCSCLYATKTFLLLTIYHWQVPISQPKMIKCDPFKRRLLWSLITIKSKSNLIGKDKVEYHQFLWCTDFINSDCLILIVEINEVLGYLEIILKSWIDWDETDSPRLENFDFKISSSRNDRMRAVNHLYFIFQNDLYLIGHYLHLKFGEYCCTMKASMKTRLEKFSME